MESEYSEREDSESRAWGPGGRGRGEGGRGLLDDALVANGVRVLHVEHLPSASKTD